MKRSEKIEVRVSVDEKETLSRLARQEGTTVSELLRNLLQKYVALNTPPSAKRLPAAAIVGLVVGGSVIGVSATLAATSSPDHPEYYLQGTIDKDAFGFPLEPTNSEPETFSVGERYKIAVHILSEEQAEVTVCSQLPTKCIEIASSKLSIASDIPWVWQTNGSNGDYIFVTLNSVS